MKIRTKLTLATLVLGGLLICYAAYQSYTGAILYQEAEAAIGINQASDLLYKAAGSYAVERGTSAGVLGNPSTASQNQIATIRTKGSEADQALAEVLEILDSGKFASLAGDIQKVQRRQKNVETLRITRDERVSAKSEGDQTELRMKLFAELTGLIMDAQALRVHLEGKLGQHMPPEIQASFVARGGLWLGSEFTGRTRGMLAGVIGAGNPLHIEQVRLIGGNSGHVETGLELAVQRRDEFSDAFATFLNDASGILFGRIAETLDKIVTSSANGEAYPLTGPEWFSLATEGIGKLLAAQNQASMEIAEKLSGVSADALTVLMVDLILLVIALVIVGAAIFVVTRQVLGPMRDIQEAMGELAGGNLEVVVPEFKRQDEISEMAEAVQLFKQSAIEAVELRRQQAEAEAKQIERQRENMLLLADTFEEQVGGSIQLVSSAATELTATASQVSSTASNTEDKSRQVAESAGIATRNIDSVATAAEELNNAITEVSGTVGDAAKAARNASEEAVEAQRRIDELDSASNRIGDVVNLILDIAEQTNLLALNATIEAARAGDAGKGFAVVANEVKSLASQTAKATDDIGAEINAMRNAIKESVTAVRGVGETIQRLSEMNNSVAAAVEEQSATTGTMSQSMADAARSVADVSGTMEDLLGNASETGAAAEQVHVATDELSMQANKMQSAVNDFLRKLREK